MSPKQGTRTACNLGLRTGGAHGVVARGGGAAR